MHSLGTNVVVGKSKCGRNERVKSSEIASRHLVLDVITMLAALARLGQPYIKRAWATTPPSIHLCQASHCQHCKQPEVCLTTSSSVQQASFTGCPHSSSLNLLCHPVGPSGLAFAYAALASGHALTLYVRNPSKVDPALGNNEKVNVVEGELADKAKVCATLKEGAVDAVITFAGPSVQAAMRRFVGRGGEKGTVSRVYLT